MDADQVYTRLARWLKTPDAPSFNPVLAMLLTPEDAALIPELSEPQSCEGLASRINFDPYLVQPRLEALIQRGWLRKNDRGYFASPANASFMSHNSLPGIPEEKEREVLITPGRFRVVIEEEKCHGCQTCGERCAFDAIEIRKVPGSKKMQAFVINEYCLGCGVCMLKCPNGAMHLEIVRPPAHIPIRPMSQASSMPPRFKEA